MTTYAVAREVPEDCTYLTAGKRYEVFKAMDFGFTLILDGRVHIYAIWEKCAHLDFKGWHRIETDADGWAEWKPSNNGEAPPDWQDGWEWQYLSSSGKWRTDVGEWDTDVVDAPHWYIDLPYRYRPCAISETAQVEPAQVECDHPNAEDYRNRAERAEAEAAEWKGRAERAEVMVATLKEVAQLWRRIGKLEVLACDQLLEGDV